MKEKLRDMVLKALGVGLFMLALAPFVYMAVIQAGLSPHPVVNALVLTLFYTLLGYVIQTIWALATKTKRVDSDVDDYFAFKKAVPAFCFALAGGIVAGVIVRINMAAQPGFSEYSIVPVLYGVMIALCMVVGTILWFFPHEVLLDKRNGLKFGILFALEALLTLLTAGVDFVVLILCVVVYAIVVSSQVAIEAALARKLKVEEELKEKEPKKELYRETYDDF